MAEKTKIEWADSTLNIWEGCQKTGSPACEGCYAEARNLRYAPKGSTEAPNWGPRAPRRELKGWRAMLRKISRLALAAFAAGRTEPWLVFVNSLSDFWDNQADPKLRAEALAAFRQHPHLTFLLLTKRPQNIVKMFAEVMRITADEHGSYDECWPRNVAIGCTVVTQAEADRDVPKLLGAAHVLRPAFTFLSIEPMVEQMNIMPYLSPVICSDPPGLYIPAEVHQQARRESGYPLIDWVITGGGTDQGKWKAPPLHPQWVRDIRDACARAGTAFLHKQNGEFISEGQTDFGGRLRDEPFWSKQIAAGKVIEWPDGMWSLRVGKKAAGRMLDGLTHDARPAVRA